MLQRSPVFLRVTEQAGEFDALDQIEDAPRPSERLYCYRRVGAPGRCHILHREKKKSGWYSVGTYELVDPQPSDEQMRDREAWRKWTREHWKKST